MTNVEFAKQAYNIATNYKTLYVTGCFGWPLNDQNKARVIAEYPSKNGKDPRYSNIMAASNDTFGFDCVNLVKGIIWGWNGDVNAEYGGCVYQTNGMMDLTEGEVMNQCYQQSEDFSKIEVGEYLWMSGHCGIYLGDGLAVECTPKWENKVQVTEVLNIKNIPKIKRYNGRTWTKHGKLPQIQYICDELPFCIKLTEDLQKGDKSKEVQLLQTRIAQLSPELELEMRSHSWNKDIQAFDGSFGKGLVGTVEKVQEQLGIKVTGTCNQELRDCLNQDFISLSTTLDQIRLILNN